MKSGDIVTVVHIGAVVQGHVLEGPNSVTGWWCMLGDNGSMHLAVPLGLEGVHYVRGRLFSWWPLHRRRRDALIAASALSDVSPLHASAVHAWARITVNRAYFDPVHPTEAALDALCAKKL